MESRSQSHVNTWPSWAGDTNTVVLGLMVHKATRYSVQTQHIYIVTFRLSQMIWMGLGHHCRNKSTMGHYDRPTPSWWLLMPWRQIGTRTSATNMPIWLWLQCNLNISGNLKIALNYVGEKSGARQPASLFLLPASSFSHSENTWCIQIIALTKERLKLLLCFMLLYH